MKINEINKEWLNHNNVRIYKREDLIEKHIRSEYGRGAVNLCEFLGARALKSLHDRMEEYLDTKEYIKLDCGYVSIETYQAAIELASELEY